MYLIVLIVANLSFYSQSFLLQIPQKQIAVQAAEHVHTMAGTTQNYLSYYYKDIHLFSAHA